MNLSCVGTAKQTLKKGKWRNETVAVTGLMSTELFLYPAYRRNKGRIFEDISAARKRGEVEIDNNSTLKKQIHLNFSEISHIAHTTRKVLKGGITHYVWELKFFVSYYDINDNEIKRYHYNDWVVMSNKLIVGMYAETITHKVLIEVTESKRIWEWSCAHKPVTFNCYAHYNSLKDKLHERFRGQVNNTIVNEYTYCRVRMKNAFRKDPVKIELKSVKYWPLKRWIGIPFNRSGVHDYWNKLPNIMDF
jgi:hypothetical protein